MTRKFNSVSNGRSSRRLRRRKGDRLARYLVDYYSQVYSGIRQGKAVSLLSRACERPVATGRAVRFEIPTRFLEHLSGKKLERGRLYLIKGRIERQRPNGQSGWTFEIYRFITPNLKLRIYLPRRFHDEVVPGEIYRVVLGSTEGKKIPRAFRDIFRLARHGGRWSRLTREPDEATTVMASNIGRLAATPGPWDAKKAGTGEMSWKVISAWIDTEGYLYVKEGRRRRYGLQIRQSEPEPLERIREFFKAQGIRRCSVNWITSSSSTTGGIYELRLQALGKLDEVVAKTKPFLMVPIRMHQYRRYLERRRESPNLVEFVEANTKGKNPSKWIDWRVVAAWIDSEGNLNTRERGPNHKDRDYRLDISQAERGPLESIRRFLNREGINSRVVKRKNGYSLQVTTVSDIDLIVRRTLPWLMTDNKRLQYEEYMTRRKRMPKRGPRPKPLLF